MGGTSANRYGVRMRRQDSSPFGVVVDGYIVAVVVVVRLLRPDGGFGVIHHNMAAFQKGLQGADLQQQQPDSHKLSRRQSLASRLERIQTWSSWKNISPSAWAVLKPKLA